MGAPINFESLSDLNITDVLLQNRPKAPDLSTINQNTGVFLDVPDFNHLYNTSTSKVILNELASVTEEDQKAIQRKIFKKTEGNSLEAYPMCDCGRTKYVRNLTSRTGKNCPKCNTPVVHQHERELEPIIWVGRPDGAEQFITPSVWYVLEAIVKANNGKSASNGFSPLRWLTNPYYRGASGGKKMLDHLEQLLSEGKVKRDYNYFVQNFDAMLDLIGGMITEPNKLMRYNNARLMIAMHRDKVFTDYLPLPNSLCVVLEQQDSSFQRMTGSAKLLMPALNHLIPLTRTPEGEVKPPLTTRQERKVKAAMASFTVDYQVYWDYVIREEIGRKPGIARKDTFGVRPPFTARGVISSIIGEHDYDEIHIPWTMACELFRPFLHVELLEEGMGPIQAESFINRHMRIYHERLDVLFKKIIRKWGKYGFKGWPASFIRNPSLYVGSNQTQFITRVKADPKDKTISLSSLSVYAYNADFDGGMNLSIASSILRASFGLRVAVMLECLSLLTAKLS